MYYVQTENEQFKKEKIGAKMNQTIVLYTNIAETRQNKRLEIIKHIDSAKRKLFKLKEWVANTKVPINIITRCSPEDNFKVELKTNEYPNLLLLYLPTICYNELSPKQFQPDYPNIVLNFIYKAANSEYHRLGERYNKIRSVHIGKFKKPRWCV